MKLTGIAIIGGVQMGDGFDVPVRPDGQYDVSISEFPTECVLNVIVRFAVDPSDILEGVGVPKITVEHFEPDWEATSTVLLQAERSVASEDRESIAFFCSYALQFIRPGEHTLTVKQTPDESVLEVIKVHVKGPYSADAPESSPLGAAPSVQ